jgi:hypothetical protein
MQTSALYTVSRSNVGGPSAEMKLDVFLIVSETSQYRHQSFRNFCVYVLNIQTRRSRRSTTLLRSRSWSRHGGHWSTSCLACFAPGAKSPGTHWSGRFGQKKNILPLPGIDLSGRTVRSLVCIPTELCGLLYNAGRTVHGVNCKTSFCCVVNFKTSCCCVVNFKTSCCCVMNFKTSCADCYVYSD